MGLDSDYTDTALHVAVRYGDYEDTKDALQDGCDPNVIGMFMWSPLHEAAQNGDIKILRLLLKSKGDPNHKDRLRGCTALHHAAREGHVKCVEALLNAGASYSIQNLDGQSPLDVASDACEEILQRKRVQDLIKLSREEARQEAILAQKVRDKPIASEGGEIDDTDIIPLSSSTTNRAPEKAWGSQSKADTKSDVVAAYLQLSFEYNIKKETLKVRVWQISDLLLPPPESSNISTIYVKSYIYPDKKKNSKRKTEEVPLQAPVSVRTKIEPKQSVSKHLSIQTIFKPRSFKFTKPLEYSHITKSSVSEKVMELQVFVTQKMTRKSFILANMKIPLDVAVKKLVRERFPVRPCMQEPLPEGMKVLTSEDVRVVYSRDKFNSNPNLRIPSWSSLKAATSAERAHSDSNLKQIEVHSMERIPSVEIPIPLDNSGSKSNLEGISVINKIPLRRKKSKVSVVIPLEDSGNRQSLKGISIVREVENAGGGHQEAPAAVNVPGELSSDDLDSSGRRKSLHEITVEKHHKESIKTAIMNTTVYIPGDREPSSVCSEQPPRFRTLRRQRSKSTPELTTTDESEMSELETSLSKTKGLFSMQLKQDVYSKVEKGKYKKKLNKSMLDLDITKDKGEPEILYHRSGEDHTLAVAELQPQVHGRRAKKLSSALPHKAPHGRQTSSVVQQDITMHDLKHNKQLSGSGETRPEKYSEGGAVVHYEDDLTGEVTPQSRRKVSLSSFQPKPIRDFSPSKRSPRKNESPRSGRKMKETSFSVDGNQTLHAVSPKNNSTMKNLHSQSNVHGRKASNLQETSFSKVEGDSESQGTSTRLQYLQRAAEINEQAMITPDYKLKLFQRTDKDPHPATPYGVKPQLDLDSSDVERLDPFYIPETPPTSSPAVHLSSRTKVQK